ncbi:TonB-linked outer membrane protein, SusC/RagA family [Zunongwangia mangrovi]|uniref:TonB-linked outer membrane protein, SusC/RagA family n=1 Tax=Zunongwangia mangrovi TaxID=1334022 RepID=A0A1I1EPI0_9FLAO|nr:TonB-dependent receptor [Zunongwangia mangrovi]SFB88562.1 TonB-linked outer membrane protein, SusC/RagA family [Zunongwangia mangrovi]
MKIKLLDHPYLTKLFVIGLLINFLLNTSVYGAETEEVDQISISGTITSSEDNLGIPGVNVFVKEVPNLGAVTDMDGNYTITAPGDATLVFSFIGYKTVERKIGGRTEINLVMDPDQDALQEVVIVGYGQQKKESVVASIAAVDGETLERTGGVTNIGSALTGNVPGVVTSASTGMPGQEDPRILIRGQSTWNNAGPLILVDGVERPMSSVAIGSVESISVLKDASATAVYGVRGANGVILITTKRGEKGKAIIRARVNTIVKVPSKLPGKYDAYDALRVKNEAIENELALNPNAWNDYLPLDIIDKYRNPANLEERERYPNVDWANTLFREYAMSYNANVNVSGGTDFVKYFTTADFLREGDLMRDYDNGRGYDPGYAFNRLNVRGNLDFQITPSTLFQVNLAGSHGVRKSPWSTANEYTRWLAAYSTAPDAFLPRYADGAWGYYAPNEGAASNSVRTLAISGIQYITTTRLTTNFTLDQDLDFILDGLNFNGTIALDNTFVEADRGINDQYNDTQEKWIDPATGTVLFQQSYNPNSRFDFQEGVEWTTSPGAVRDWSSYRKLFYQFQLKYAKNFGGKHDLAVMGLMNRNENATGSEIPRFREDWVFRTTYTFDNKYTLEYNGAYNGSEKFSPENRFAFFSSGGLGWILSRERLLEKVSWLDLLKLRANYGEIGDDNVNGRFLYMTQWGYGGQSRMGVTGEAAEQSPYTWFNEQSVGNPEVSWERVKKANIGIDFGFFNGFVEGSFDYFRDERTDILINGNSRAIPSYYGTEAPVANLGEVKNEGFEFDVNLNYRFENGLRLWSNVNMTLAQNEVINADDPSLLPAYQKNAGFQIGQAYSYVTPGFYNNWDQLYGSTIHNTNDNQKLPGNYHLVDFNGDGVIDNYDNIPYGFTGSPQRTYNTTVGFDWKGFSSYVQFYGVENVTRQVVLGSLSSQNHVVYEEGSYWSKNNMNADSPVPRWLTTPSSYNVANRYMYDGSYLRLKNAEIAYTFDSTSSLAERLGVKNLRLFLSGNNLFLWTDMPDDRESNFAGTGWASQGAYPTVKRFNLGLNITF